MCTPDSLLVTWTCGNPKIEFLIPDETLGSVQLHMLKPFWHQLSLSLSQHFSKLRQRHGASWWAAREGSALRGKTNFLCVVQCEDIVLKLFQDLTSMISCLILLGTWQCSDGLVYKMRSFVKACQKSVIMPLCILSVSSWLCGFLLVTAGKLFLHL